MNTSKPISTVSWNSKQFLISKLNELVEAHFIEYWDFIHHKSEDDEAGKKPHFHLYIEPCKRLNTLTLKDFFNEFDPKHPDKPLSCLTFRSSKFSDWYLYVLHDPAYLIAHNLEKKFHYQDKQFVFCAKSEHLFRVRSCDMSEYSPISKLITFKLSGLSFTDAVQRGLIPLPQIKNYELAWSMIPVPFDNG